MLGSIVLRLTSPPQLIGKKIWVKKNLGRKLFKHWRWHETSSVKGKFFLEVCHGQTTRQTTSQSDKESRSLQQQGATKKHDCLTSEGHIHVLFVAASSSPVGRVASEPSRAVPLSRYILGDHLQVRVRLVGVQVMTGAVAFRHVRSRQGKGDRDRELALIWIYKNKNKFQAFFTSWLLLP